MTRSATLTRLALVIAALTAGAGRGTSRADVPADGPARIGEVVADLRFKDIRGLVRAAADLGPRRAYVLVFVTTDCPLVRRALPKLVEFDAAYRDRDVQFVAVNVGAGDSLKDMAAQAIEFGAPFPFVKDEGLACTTRLGIERTPEVAVFDDGWRLVYRGRIDDQERLGGTRPQPTRRDLALAIDAVLAGEAVAVATTPVDGCRITSPPDDDEPGPAPTYHADVAPILARRCVSCHREGTAAPFALRTHADAAAHAEMLAEVVRDERMPPWGAHPAYGTFQNDPSLSREEKRTLLRWVRTGRAEGTPPAAGELADAPPPAPDPGGWRIGEPDLVISMAEPQEVPATGYVPYRYVVLPHVFLRETWIEAVEIRPDNPGVVHHCNMAYVTAGGAGADTFITGHVPGGQPLDLGHFDTGVAYRVPAFAGLVLQIHYTTTGRPETCRISVGLRFPRRPIEKRLHHVLFDPRDLAIPPGDGGHAVEASTTLADDVTLLGMFTHMHVRGKDMTFFTEPPGGLRKTLLMIPAFNFDWQLGYECAPGTVRLPAGSVLGAVAHYDNSAFNPYNPDPARTVPYGDQTYDEMFNGYVFFTVDAERLDVRVDPRSGTARPEGAALQPQSPAP